MNKLTKRISLCILSGALIFTPAAAGIPDNAIVSEAHSGRTDSSGGHHDNKNASGLGSYHYHCGGHPAHLHEGGVCPYSTSSASYNDDSSSDADTSASSSAGTSVSASSSNSTSSSSSGAGISRGRGRIALHDGGTAEVSSDLLKIVQDVLNEKGYDCGKADGLAGEKTKKAISDYLEDTKEDSSDRMIIEMVAEALAI